jgi:hypothetical protein
VIEVGGLVAGGLFFLDTIVLCFVSLISELVVLEFEIEVCNSKILSVIVFILVIISNLILYLST